MRLLLMLLPWLELFSLIQLGIETSALTALFYVLATFVLGMAVLRYQGVNMFERIRQQQVEGRLVGAGLLLDDMAIGLAGILLMIPGLISDFCAVVVLIGPLRRRVAGWLGGPQPERFEEFESHHRPQPGPGAHTTIDGEYRRVDDP